MVEQSRSPANDAELIFGVNAVKEILLSASRSIEILYCGEHAGKRIIELENLARERGIVLKRLPKSALDRLASHGRHQGVIARVPPVSYCSLKELLSMEGEDDCPGMKIILALDGITDPQNLGSVIRTAASAGIAGVIIPERRSAGITPTVVRVASGGLEYLKICRVKNLVNALQEGRKQGFWIAGTVANDDSSLYDADLCRQLIVVIGSEDKGIRPLVRKNCDFLLTIPLYSPLDSLNVAAATAIVLFEARRQQQTVAGI